MGKEAVNMNIKNKTKPTFSLWEVIVIVVVTSIIMISVTGYISFRREGGINYRELINNPHISEFISTYNTIVNNFFDEVDEAALIDAAINGMLSELDDPHTTLLDRQNSEHLIDTLRGTYQGVGILISDQLGVPLIIQVFEESPAERAGVLAGDIIRYLNDTDVSEKSATEIVEMIRGRGNRQIEMLIEREGEEDLVEFQLSKGTIVIPQVHSETFEQNNQLVGYLRVDVFSENIASQFRRRLLELEQLNIDSLIIDLRNNTGGYLLGANEIASMFLEEGAIIYQLRQRNATTMERVTTSESRNIPVYILINGNTASASEILAAALRDSYSGDVLLIGETSFGKGLIQTTSVLSSGAMIRYSNAEWLTPKGEIVNDIGLVPDVLIRFELEEGQEFNFQNDNQLQEAIRRISQR